MVRVFDGVGHHTWARTDRVLDCVLQELNPDYRTAWRRPHADSPAGVGLAQLLAEAMEQEGQVALEDLPRPARSFLAVDLTQ